MPRPAYNLELIKNSQLTPNTISLTFQVENPPAFEAGQFISLLFNHNGEEMKRSYSIASAPELLSGQGLLEVAIGLVPGGCASERFSSAKEGEQFQMTGPFGILTLPEELPKRVIFAGTGTGVAPYRSMLPQLEKLKQQGQHIHILMGARHREDLFYVNDFQDLSKDSDNIAFEACLSREPNINSQGGEYKGYVQGRFTELSLTPGEDLIYLCGNPSMIDDSVKWLTEQGFGPRQIKREKYTFSR